MAGGSDAITGVTFDGYSYAHDLKEGKPVRLSNITVGEKATVKKGAVTVTLPASSGAIINLDC